MERSRTYLGFGLATIFALVAVAFFLAGQIQTTSAAGGGPEMRLTAGTASCAADCTFALGEKFTLAVEVVQGPATPYVGAQSWVVFGTDLVYDASAAAAADEIVWPDCAGLVAQRTQTTPDSVFHGCLTGLTPPLPASTFTGNIVEISLTCSATDSVTNIRLMNSDVTAPSAFALPDTTEVSPKVSDLSVTCGAGAPADTPTNTPPPPTNTPCPGGVCPTATPGPTDTPTPTATPVPEFVCGDVDRNGEIDGLDSLWVLWFDAGLVPALLPLKDNNQDTLVDLIGDVNNDRNVNSIDAALIDQFVAGLLSTLDGCE